MDNTVCDGHLELLFFLGGEPMLVSIREKVIFSIRAKVIFSGVLGLLELTILPCEYDFPSSNFTSAIALASTFTDVVLSTLPDIQFRFGNDNDAGLIRGVGSVIGQEGEQNGFYRQILKKVPSALPFLTAGARDFALSAIVQNFVVKNSCPSLGVLEPTLTIFEPLTVVTDPSQITSDMDSVIEFSIEFSIESVPSMSKAKRDYMPKSYYTAEGMNGLQVTYINQQNVPLSYEFEVISINNGLITFRAPFPGETHEMNGLTIAAVTHGGNFTDPDLVAQMTQFGPGLIEVN